MCVCVCVCLLRVNIVNETDIIEWWNEICVNSKDIFSTIMSNFNITAQYIHETCLSVLQHLFIPSILESNFYVIDATVLFVENALNCADSSRMLFLWFPFKTNLKTASKCEGIVVRLCGMNSVNAIKTSLQLTAFY